MAEVGLLPFARIALQVSKAVPPALPQPFQPAPIHTTAVVGHSLPAALRGPVASMPPIERRR